MAKKEELPLASDMAFSKDDIDMSVLDKSGRAFANAVLEEVRSRLLSEKSIHEAVDRIMGGK